MASARHPTIEPDGDDDVNQDRRTRRDGDLPDVGIAHPTVVPTNADDPDR